MLVYCVCVCGLVPQRFSHTFTYFDILKDIEVIWGALDSDVVLFSSITTGLHHGNLWRCPRAKAGAISHKMLEGQFGTFTQCWSSSFGFVYTRYTSSPLSFFLAWHMHFLRLFHSPVHLNSSKTSASNHKIQHKQEWWLVFLTNLHCSEPF